MAGGRPGVPADTAVSRTARTQAHARKRSRDRDFGFTKAAYAIPPSLKLR